MRYAIVIAKAEKNYGAYVPDLPGCVATGKTVEETVQQLREATELHLEGLRDGGGPPAFCDYVESQCNGPRLIRPRRR
jgi:predicted RNase H-like HicB family nuclease